MRAERTAAGLAGMSVRSRITITVAVLTALALASAAGLVLALESARIERQTFARIEQEVAEFRNMRTGTDPATNRPFTSVRALIELFLERNVPDGDEALIGYWDGTTQISSESPHPDFGRSPVLLDVVGQRLERGGSERLDTEYGDVLVTVVPTRMAGDPAAGALVVVNFLREDYADLEQTLRTYLIVAALLLLLVTGIATWQAGRLLSPLRTLRSAAQSISETDLSRRIPETGNDDITALTRTFNQMLERLDGAFRDQRQFLDDAGHELRTPLTVLRGHLELADADNAEEIAATRVLLLDEVDRMSRLVGDLTTLAKTDRPDFLRLEPVDVAPFLGSVLGKCRALGDRAWRLDETADAVVVLDAQRITQALLQLAQNAVQHTRRGDEIGLGSRVVGSWLAIWVRDSGPGVPVEDRERVFARFVRGAEAHEEGFGLGLSIVSAIADAHSGSADVTDAPGGGAVFMLHLPLEREETPWPAS